MFPVKLRACSGSGGHVERDHNRILMASFKRATLLWQLLWQSLWQFERMAALLEGPQGAGQSNRVIAFGGRLPLCLLRDRNCVQRKLEP